MKPLASVFGKYALVSVVAVLVTQVVLVTCHGALKMPATTSNVIAVSVGAIPAYVLNRRWTWGKTGKNHLLREVAPFWGMSLLGLVLSTWLVAEAESRWEGTVAVSLANLTGFGVLWVAKFALLHLVLFRRHDDNDDNDDNDDIPARV